MPLVARWVNSISVSADGLRGMTTPLQRGQWRPHPAPAPDARTNAPHSTTPTLYARTIQAKRAKRACAVWGLIRASISGRSAGARW